MFFSLTLWSTKAFANISHDLLCSIYVDKSLVSLAFINVCSHMCTTTHFYQMNLLVTLIPNDIEYWSFLFSTGIYFNSLFQHILEWIRQMGNLQVVAHVCACNTSNVPNLPLTLLMVSWIANVSGVFSVMNFPSFVCEWEIHVIVARKDLFMYIYFRLLCLHNVWPCTHNCSAIPLNGVSRSWSKWETLNITSQKFSKPVIVTGITVTYFHFQPEKYVQEALCHVNDELRLDAFAVICSTSKKSGQWREGFIYIRW